MASSQEMAAEQSMAATAAGVGPGACSWPRAREVIRG